MVGDPRNFEARSASALQSGLSRSDLTIDELWSGYISVGGSGGVADLEAVVAGDGTVSPHEHDLVAQALNDHFVEHGLDHPVPYAADLGRDVSA